MIIGPVSGFVPRPYQEHCINGGDPRRGIGIMPAFARYKRVLAVMATGCHAKGQPLMMMDGSTKLVEDIEVGDLLMGPDLTPRTVLSLARGRQAMAIIKPETGAQWVVNMDHVITVTDELLFDIGHPVTWVDMSVREFLRLSGSRRRSYNMIRVAMGPPPMDPGQYLGDAMVLVDQRPVVRGHSAVEFTITPAMRVDDYFGFELDGDHRYLLADGTVTHNCGKTELYLSVARRFLESPKTPPGKRVLILAHRDELVSQPIERAHRFGMRLAREQGKESGVGRMERVVASTIQSMGNRLDRYKPDEFGLIVIDEAHHSPADIFGKLLDHFMHSFVLGVTATPDRLDGVGLGEVFEACAFNYGIEEATEDGWLVPVLPKEITIDGLDISKMRARMGDLPPGPLGELLAEYAMPVAKHIVEHAGDRPTLVFCSTVAHAHAQAEALRRYTSARVEVADGGTSKTHNRGTYTCLKTCAWSYANCALGTSQAECGDCSEHGGPSPGSKAIHGGAFGGAKHHRSTIKDSFMSPKQWSVLTKLGIDECAHCMLSGPDVVIAESLVALGYASRIGRIQESRSNILSDYKNNVAQFVCNAALFTEGVDAPSTACVAIVRPTKSRGLVTQVVGRGTRPVPGLVDHPELRDSPEGRRAAIAASAKPNVLVLDFCAQVEQLGLVSVADVLAGKLTPEERLALGKLDICGDKTIDELTQEARRVAAVEAAAAAALSDAEASVRDIDPFNPAAILSIRDMPRNNPSEARCSEKMAAYLIRQGIANAATLSTSQAKKLQGALGMRLKLELASYRQQVALQKAGVPPASTSRMRYSTAADLIAVLVSNDWRRPVAWERDPRLGGRAPVEKPAVSLARSPAG